jgi:hypothetical protein
MITSSLHDPVYSVTPTDPNSVETRGSHKVVNQYLLCAGFYLVRRRTAAGVEQSASLPATRRTVVSELTTKGARS